MWAEAAIARFNASDTSLCPVASAPNERIETPTPSCARIAVGRDSSKAESNRFINVKKG
jgi:hypothetical protein